LNVKAVSFVKIVETMGHIFKSSISRHTRVPIYMTFATALLCYGSDSWAVRRADEERLITAEMHFRRKIRIHLWKPPRVK
jgi:hypothetical protein